MATKIIQTEIPIVLLIQAEEIGALVVRTDKMGTIEIISDEGAFGGTRSARTANLSLL